MRFSSPKIFSYINFFHDRRIRLMVAKISNSFPLSPINNSNLKLNTNYMISNCNTHESIFTLSYVSGLNINSTLFTIIFKRGHYKNHHVFRTSLRLLQITAPYIYPVTSVWNSFKFCRSLPIIFTILYDLVSYTVLTARRRVILQKITSSKLVKKYPAIYGTWRFITAITKAGHMSLN